MARNIALPDGTSVVANLFDDNFAGETNVPWNLTLANAATLALSAAAGDYVEGGQGMKFTSGTSASSEIHRYETPPPNARRVFFEIVCAVMDENPSNVAFYTSIRDATNWIRAKVLHVYSTNVWSYQDSAGVQQPLLTRDTSESTSVARWHRILTGIDLATQTYNLVAVDDQDFTAQVRGQALRNTADAAAPFLLDFAVEFTNTATPGVLNIDRVAAAAV